MKVRNEAGETHAAIMRFLTPKPAPDDACATCYPGRCWCYDNGPTNAVGWGGPVPLGRCPTCYIPEQQDELFGNGTLSAEVISFHRWGRATTYAEICPSCDGSGRSKP